MRLMISTMRDEAPFLLEWIAYHRAIGFTDFLIYTNDCQDGTDALLDRLDAMGIVTHKPNPRAGRKAVQWQALSRAIKHPMVKRAEWIMVADVDEFLNIHCGAGKLDDLIAAVPNADAFSIPWRMFGNSGLLEFRPNLVIEQFTHAAPSRMLWPLKASQIKTLFRMSPDVQRFGVHKQHYAGTAQSGKIWVDGNGRAVAPQAGSFLITTDEKYQLAQINHYALGSAQNFLVKVARGRPNQMDSPIDLGYWVERNFNTVEDRTILRHHAAVREGVDALLQDPEIARLHQAGIDWRKNRIAELLRDHANFMLFSRLAQSPQTPVLAMNLQISLCRLRSQAHPARHVEGDDSL